MCITVVIAGERHWTRLSQWRCCLHIWHVQPQHLSTRRLCQEYV